MTQLLLDLQGIFQRIFDADELRISPETTATDIDGWDSMAHINLVVAIEKHFGVKFSASDIAALGRGGQNVGNMMALLESKLGQRSRTQ